MRQTTTGEMRLDERKAMGCSFAKRAILIFGCKHGWLRSNFTAVALMKRKITPNTGKSGSRTTPIEERKRKRKPMVAKIG
jgi:hypothetical protein